MGLIIANSNSTIQLGGRVIAAVKNYQFSPSREAKETTAIDCPSGWRTYAGGLRNATLSGTINYIPDNPTHGNVAGGLIGDLGSQNMLSNPSFEGTVGATTCAGWTEVNAVDTHTLDATYTKYGKTSLKIIEATVDRTIGFKQDVVLAFGATYYASVWCLPSVVTGAGVNWTLTGSDTGQIYQVAPSQGSAWVRLSKTFTTATPGETLTFFVGGSGTSYWDGASLVAGSFLTDFMENEGMNSYVLTLPQSDGYVTTITGTGKLTKLDPKASVGELLEAEFEIQLSGVPVYATTTP
jgi:hypothetical protein